MAVRREDGARGWGGIQRLRHKPVPGFHVRAHTLRTPLHAIAGFTGLPSLRRSDSIELKPVRWQRGSTAPRSGLG